MSFHGGRVGAYHVNKTCHAGLRIEMPDGPGDVESPVAALGYVLWVAEREH